MYYSSSSTVKLLKMHSALKPIRACTLLKKKKSVAFKKKKVNIKRPKSDFHEGQSLLSRIEIASDQTYLCKHVLLLKPKCMHLCGCVDFEVRHLKVYFLDLILNCQCCKVHYFAFLFTKLRLPS